MAAQQVFQAPQHVQEALFDYLRFYRRDVCEKWLLGECRKTNCRWAHGNHEVEEVPLGFSRPYKKRVCKNFKKSKVCPNGVACWFSHGEAKNSVCKFEGESGYCFGDFGAYCPFRHNN